MGGVVFGVMMAFMGTLSMIGKMVGFPNAVTGFVVHLTISAGIGGSFGVLLGPAVTGRISGLVAGLAYGSVWWFLGPLTLMPLFLGMGFGVNWNAAAAANMLPSLMGHAIFGLVTGLAYSKGDNCFVLKVGKSDDQSAGDKPNLRSVS
ncbi:MAG: hypothetical protein ABFS42_14120, partial [Candidatus Krumholzibacteriota bacterium]